MKIEEHKATLFEQVSISQKIIIQYIVINSFPVSGFMMDTQYSLMHNINVLELIQRNQQCINLKQSSQNMHLIKGA